MLWFLAQSLAHREDQYIFIEKKSIKVNNIYSFYLIEVPGS